MKIKIQNDHDAFTLGQLADLPNPRSLIELVGTFASLQVPPDDDLEVIIHKQMLADSYKSNPSVLGIKILAKTNELFQDSAGFGTPNAPLHVTVMLHRQRKPDTARRTTVTPSVKQVIKDWLALNLPPTEALDIPVSDIPAFFTTHPEQLTYQVKRETSTAIKIKRLKTKWLITRK